MVVGELSAEGRRAVERWFCRLLEDRHPGTTWMIERAEYGPPVEPSTEKEGS